MKCRKVLKKLNAYIDGECDSKTEKAIKAHLELCNSCKKEYEDSLKLNSMLKDAHSSPSEQLIDTIFDKIERSSDEREYFWNSPAFSFAFKVLAIIFTIVSLYIGILSGNKLYEKIMTPNNYSSDSFAALFQDEVGEDPFLSVFNEIDGEKNEK